jgi:hypothetical protein
MVTLAQSLGVGIGYFYEDTREKTQTTARSGMSITQGWVLPGGVAHRKTG